ncbi:UNVERIFIED_CONTAM: hypothetical protein Sindi_0590200 [Sesamum indicum]
MATFPSNLPRRQTTSLPPPRRGRVKAQVFKSVAGNLSSLAGHVLAKFKGDSSAAAAASDAPISVSTSASASTSASPPASTYASDGYPDQVDDVVYYDVSDHESFCFTVGSDDDDD